MCWNEDLEGVSARTRARIALAVCLISTPAGMTMGCGGGSGPTAVTQPPLVEEGNASCLERANFGDPTQSAYVLPYPVGDASEVLASYCSSFTYPENIGIDFDLAQGANVVAARRGTVIEVVDRFEDAGEILGQSNRILIEHPNGSMAFYLHLAEGSAAVQVGESVQQGQLLAEVGGSGAPFPHLHFSVFATSRLESSIAGYLERDDSLPINFRNSDGPLDSRGGLIAGQQYQALPY